MTIFAPHLFYKIIMKIGANITNYNTQNNTYSRHNTKKQPADTVCFCSVGKSPKKHSVLEKIGLFFYDIKEKMVSDYEFLTEQKGESKRDIENKTKNILNFKPQDFKNLTREIVLEEKSVPKNILKRAKTLKQKDSNYEKTLDALVYSTVCLGEYFKKVTERKLLNFENHRDLAKSYVESIKQGQDVDVREMTAEFTDKRATVYIAPKKEVNRRFSGTFFEKNTKDFYNTWHDRGIFAVLGEKMDSAISLANSDPKKLNAFLENELAYAQKLKNNESDLKHEIFNLFHNINNIGESEISLGAIGERFDAHGIKRGNEEEIFAQLDNLLTNGIDKNRRFYTAPLDFSESSKGASAAFGVANGAYKDGPFVLVAQMDKSLEEDGIKYIIVNYSAQPKMAELVEKYPDYEFVKIQDANEFFSKPGKDST